MTQNNFAKDFLASWVVFLVALPLGMGIAIASGLGGAILNAGNLTIEASACSPATRASPARPAPPLRRRPLLQRRGSSLTVTDSTIAGNTAQSGGGGIAAGGNLNLANVTISGNHADADFGGGLYFFADAKGTANNVTVSGNSAASRGAACWSRTTPSSASPRRSPTRSSPATRPPPVPGLLGGPRLLLRPDRQRRRLHRPRGGQARQGGDGGEPDRPQARPPGRATAAPLRPPPLLTGSPAIDAGNPAAPGSGNGACEATDQRGVRRPGGAACDIGAFEATTACVAGGTTLCLSNGRFQVTATWQTLDQRPRQARR